ncbi:MAG: hypothetical protein HFE32_04400 [Clostridia bacterium]|nr:hypothetical protein [Clostridia bacterium]
MKTTVRQQKFYKSEEDYEENCYLFSPAISKQQTVNGKSYFVRGYFRGKQDFELTMQQLAMKQNTKNAG